MRLEDIATSGFAIGPGILSANDVDSVLSGLTQLDSEEARQGRGGIRNLLDVSPDVKRLASSQCIRDLVERVLGQAAFAVRGTLFDKTPVANWKVPWHQDLSIAVQEREEVEGYGPWTTKAGVLHVQPHVSILENMLAVRIHLDDCGEDNGALRVIPGSHLWGRLSAAQIQTIAATERSVSCPVGSGGVLLMRPLLLHSSSASETPKHRRVIHIDFASTPLPGGLKWFAN